MIRARYRYYAIQGIEIRSGDVRLLKYHQHLSTIAEFELDIPALIGRQL